MAALKFTISHRSNECPARVGRVETLHGAFDTPAFMPVGTKATVKGQLPGNVAETGAQIILGNTYHLMLRPGSELVAHHGGLHQFMAWDGAILTDSGGFQVFSLGDINQIDEDGVTFKSHLDGAMHRLTAERSMKIQNDLGADIIMAFDDCPPGGVGGSGFGVREEAVDRTANRKPQTVNYAERNRAAAERTIRWLERCKVAHMRKEEQSLFGIVQGGTDLALRSWCAEHVTGLDLPGYAIGGVAVGEPAEEIAKVVRHTAALLPVDKPRYLMGVGYERDIVEAVRGGVDMFDCVLPTRNGRNANAFTRGGQIRLRNAGYALDRGPIDERCDCLACRRFSRGYIRHLFMADEMLGPILVSLHNLRHFQRLMLDIRRAIRDDGWSSLRAEWPVLGSDKGNTDHV
ncbi:MAG: tRNA guanosine(34) transglycosylase Tgt [Phycisphaerales bacterium]